LITTAGRKAVIGRPILYKTTKEFLLRFGLSDLSELPSMEEFEKLAGESLKGELFEPVANATGVPDAPSEAASPEQSQSRSSEDVEEKQSLSGEPLEVERLASPPETT